MNIPIRKQPALFALLLCGACSQHDTGPLETGLWGGEGIELRVTATNASVEFDCAVGEIPGPITVYDGEFSVDGRLARVAGAVRENEQLEWHATRYTGLTGRAGRMHLTVSVLDQPESSTSYELYHNRAGIVRRCL